MRILMFSDTHIHAWPRHSIMTEGQFNSRLLDGVKVLRQIIRAVEKYEVDKVIFLGDLFHEREQIDVPTWNITAPYIRQLADITPEGLEMVAGNHDMALIPLPEGNRAAFTALQELSVGNPKVHLHEEPHTELVGGKKGDYRFIYIPYIKGLGDEATEWEDGNTEFVDDLLTGLCDSVSQAEKSVIFTHVGISGAEAQRGIRLREAIKGEIFENAGISAVFSGHYHIPQRTERNGMPFIYVGATHHQNWGDVGQSRGFLLWDTEDDEFKIRRIRIKAPQFVVVKASTEKEIKKHSEEITGHFVKIVVPADMGREEVEHLRQVGHELEPLDLQIDREYVKKSKSKNESLKLQRATSEEDRVKQWVKNEGMKGKKAEHLVALGTEFLP